MPQGLQWIWKKYRSKRNNAGEPTVISVFMSLPQYFPPSYMHTHIHIHNVYSYMVHTIFICFVYLMVTYMCVLNTRILILNLIAYYSTLRTIVICKPTNEFYIFSYRSQYWPQPNPNPHPLPPLPHPSTLIIIEPDVTLVRIMVAASRIPIRQSSRYIVSMLGISIRLAVFNTTITWQR